jgi:hypothetical protein
MVACVLCSGAVVGGCLERSGAPIGPEIGFGQAVTIGGAGVSAVDLLFVIDDSGSMNEEQTALAREIPQLVRDLASPPDRDGDGAADWPAAESLRIAIANTDVGTGAIQYTNSHCTPGGDDGMLHGAGIYEWAPGQDADAFAAQVGAVVENIGIAGCAFEQQLEATGRALDRAKDGGFPREDALLAIILVTDEEDCSVVDDDAFFASVDRSAPNVHCTRNASGLTSVAALAEQLRGDRAVEDVVFAAITGIPRDLPPDVTPAQINALSAMQYEERVYDVSLEPRRVCEFIVPGGTSLGGAAPARRIVELAGHFPGSVLHSICTDDFGPAIEEIAARVGERIPGVCLVRALPDGRPGEVPCKVSVTLPEGEACSSHAGYSLLGNEAGLDVCEVVQVEAGSGADGWYYDPADASCPQLVLTEASIPPLGSNITAECFFTVYRALGEQCARPSQCGSGWCDPFEQVCAPLPESEAPPTGG